HRSLLFICLWTPFLMARVPLVQFNSIQKELREGGQLEQFWRNNVPESFARKYYLAFHLIFFVHENCKGKAQYYGEVALVVRITHNQFKSFLSHSYQHGGRQFSLRYGTGHLMGICSKDVVQISNISIEAQDFGESLLEPGNTFVSAHFDGVLGLAYPNLSVMDAVPVFDNIMRQNLVEEPVFSFFLNRDGTKDGGELIFGGIDHSLYHGPMYWIPVSRKMYWQIPLESVKIQGQIVACKNGCEAIVDSGTSLITGPLLDIKKLQAKIGAVPNPSGEVNKILGWKDKIVIMNDLRVNEKEVSCCCFMAQSFPGACHCLATFKHGFNCFFKRLLNPCFKEA
uniref:Peptidase A1 domain-containing protein n=1 Tax=Naja naja TaxID=35670 RepID=A0A8C6VNE6_NAJNA